MTCSRTIRTTAWLRGCESPVGRQARAEKTAIVRAPRCQRDGGRSIEAGNALRVGNPDVLDLYRFAEKLVGVTHRGPVTRSAVIDPRTLQVPGGCPLDDRAALLRSEIPDRLHVIVIRQHLGENITLPG